MTVWQLTIPYVWIQPGCQATVRVTLEPAEMLMLRKGLATIAELHDAYREAIERGSCTLYEVIPDAHPVAQ